MLNIFLVISMMLLLLGMNQVPQQSPNLSSIKIERSDNNFSIISGLFSEGLSAYLVIKQQFVEIILVVTDSKIRLTNSAKINRLKDIFIEQIMLNNQTQNIILNSFADERDFYLAIKNIMPRVALWHSAKKL